MPSTHSALLFLRALGLSSVIGMLRYSLRKERLNRRFQTSQKYLPSQSVGSLQRHQFTGDCLHAIFENASLEIRFLAPDLVRLTWQPGRLPIPYAIAGREILGAGQAAPQVSILEDPPDLVVKTDQLQVRLHQDGGLQFHDGSGRMLRQELPAQFNRAVSADPEKTRWSNQAVLDGRERILGLGLHNGPLSLTGHSFSLWNTDPGGIHDPDTDPLYMPLPVYLSLQTGQSYLIFYENSYPARFEFDTSTTQGKAQASFSGGALRYYLIVGPPPVLLERLSALTGRPALPPRWSLGYHQSRWGYRTASEVRQIVDGFSAHNLPLDALHLDIDYMDGYRVFTVHPKRFPDLPALAADLHTQGVRLVAIIDPGIKVDPSYNLYRQGDQQSNYLLASDNRPVKGVVWPGECVFPDFSDPQARRWWGEQYQDLLAAGVDGFWHDMNEPATFSITGDSSLPLAGQASLEGAPGEYHQVHNLYGMLMNRAAFEGIQRLQPDRRPWILSRSGWVGNARYAWNWTGDIESSWTGLRQTLASLLNLGLSGIPYSGSDIGGFTGDPSPELYLRWFQMATFNALMRTHSMLGTAPHEPWRFGDPYTSIARDFLNLRRSLLPYTYTLAWQASQTGWPLVRPLFWEHPDDQLLWEVSDCFLFGEVLLVAPVLEPGATTRTVRLPPGAWFDFWTDEVLVGPGDLLRPVSLERLPLLVRDHSLLPRSQDDQLCLHLYTTGKSLKDTPRMCGQLFSDAGDGFGASRLDRFYLSARSGQLRLTCRSQGDFPFPYTSIRLVLHGLQPVKILVDHQPVENYSEIVLSQPFKEATITIL